MTLAVAILLLSISSTAVSPELTTAQEQSAPPSATNPSTDTKATTPEHSGQTPSTKPKSTKTRKHPHPKKAVASDCATAPSTASGSSSSTPAGSEQSGGNPTETPDATQTTNKNCPPEKVIVRQGGTAEPSIQLAGGDQAAQKKDAANRMLGLTEVNLKKISGQQLTSAQQDTVSQIRQFVDQSKTALASGDLERGRTLAWKAHLLSEDLVNPQK